MLIYEAYCWFSRALKGRAERERRSACGVLLAFFILLYLHSEEAVPFQAAMSRGAATVLGVSNHASLLDATRTP